MADEKPTQTDDDQSEDQRNEDTAEDTSAEDSDTEESSDGDVVEEKRIEVDDEVVGKIADAIAEKSLAKALEADKSNSKKLGVPAAVKQTGSIEKEGKEVRFIKALGAKMSGDLSKLKAYNEFALDSRAKAGYGNEGTDADGGYLVPDADFETDVLRLEEEYGAARQGGVRVKRVNSNALKLNLKNSGVTMYATNEAAAKTGTKMTFAQKDVTLVKYAAIAAVSDELEEDSAVDFYNELTRDFAREKARIEDVRVFTHATSGLVHQAGLNINSVHASAFTGNVDFDDLYDAMYSVPSASATRGTWFLNPYAWNVIRKLKIASEANHYAINPNAGPNLPALTLLGRPVVLTEVLDSTEGANKAFVVFGDLANVTLIEKRGLVLDLLREGTVHDSTGAAVNLGEQDMKALRAVARLNAVTVFPDAFSVIGTGTVS